MATSIRTTVLALMLGGALCAQAGANNRYGGVNLSGAEFGEALPGEPSVDYTWPTNAEIDYFRSRGMNIVRIQFLWERLQPAMYGDFEADYLAPLDGLVAHATAAGVRVILNPQNFARYYGDVIGSAAVPNDAFADFWSRLADRYAGNDRVVFGLMNEPNSMPTEQWVDAANAAIAAIRATGATQLILVPGNAWTGAWSWNDEWYGTPNGTAMLSIVDDGPHAFEVHQYFDADRGGEQPTCEAGTGEAQLLAMTAWLRANGVRGFLAETAGGNSAACRSAIESALSHLRTYADVWLGWAWWAAGPDWQDYPFSLEPTGNLTVDAPQMSWLLPYMPPLFADGFEGG
ncbi:glycoside hydrolase family 5 protein [Dokdonella sp.]|uniref:glycoside hydrolase family 5 protein n=1 Tax=Dokdonella sp. TaxID=2291710 RepID=UPI001B2651DB|nr:glycoside hydrolase family 5 protein [Dokdonella sp.]MBO9663890.1 glycoside hydrolase family 5 protein [Dokdonella sp.]